EQGIEVDVGAWKRDSWWHHLRRATEEIAAVVPPECSLILVDEDQWGTEEEILGRRRFLFLERDGYCWGPPDDDETAIRELERLRRCGASFMAFGWPAFWWLESYPDFHHHLRGRFPCVLENDRLVVFDLRR